MQPLADEKNREGWIHDYVDALEKRCSPMDVDSAVAEANGKTRVRSLSPDPDDPPPGRPVVNKRRPVVKTLHLYRAEEDGRIHFANESGDHLAVSASEWEQLGEPDAIFCLVVAS